MQNPYKITGSVNTFVEALQSWEFLCCQIRTVEVAFADQHARHAKLANTTAKNR